VYLNGILVTKEGIDLYFQEKIIKDGVRGIIDVDTSKSIGQMKETYSDLRMYLNKERVYVSQASLGLIDARLIGIFLQADPHITFRDGLNQATMEVMLDDTPIYIFPKRVKEPSNDSYKLRFTNGLSVQVAIPDNKKAVE
jgi:hypothetical protein